jgi:opacity protein-like surface antigen
LSCCSVVVVVVVAAATAAAAAAAAAAAVAVGPAGVVGCGAVAEAVGSGQQNLILGATCDSRYHPGTNGKKREGEGGIRRQGKGDDMAAEVGSPGDGGDRTTEGDMNLLGTDWDKGRPWAGRTEQDVGTEWLRRRDCTKRRSRTWSDRERAARGEGNVIPGAGGRSSLGWVTRRLNIM